jgi:poly(hydroxyalkanoate) depolymerase family esterase
MNDIFRNLNEATRLTKEGRLHEAGETLQRAFGNAATAAGDMADAALSHLFASHRPQAEAPAADAVPATRGHLVDGRCTLDGQARDYRLYVPHGHEGRALPLVVMLHGCTQNPDDFAAGTGMNELADEQGFFVLYPAQSAEANAHGCWNWFEQTHQQRDAGEPALLAAMTQSVIAAHGIDAGRVYVAGMSAGGAMADVLAAAYPDIFAAVGVHSGVPCGSAASVAEAFAVMGSGETEAQATPAGAADGRTPVPIIVFHGDQDRTVHPRNGERMIAATLERASATNGQGGAAARARVERGVSERGREYTRTVHEDHDGSPLAEHWLVHGSGHAWSGGRPEGSYTDVQGPDATREMLRFFFAQSRDAG